MPDLTILSRDAEAIAVAVTAAGLPDLKLATVTHDPASLSPVEVTLLLADPDLAATVVERCVGLTWLQSTWAGITPLSRVSKRDYTLTGLKGIFDEPMREYVAAYLLYFSRRINEFHPRIGTPAAPPRPRWQPPEIDTLSGKTLGVLGAGSIGAALIPLARCFGMRITGLTRSGTSEHEYDQVYSPEERLAFARALDYLVCLLPDTPATRGFIDNTLLASLPKHAVLINAGRGAVVDDEALLAMLDRDHLQGAVLDVFQEEPLPESHPYWDHPRVWVTQHTAALSAPERVARVFMDNYQRWRQQSPLFGVIDLDRGY